ncbi:MAG: integration host factor subunit alpha [Proteobacteria bacterium]|nr:integration host factor subunit alpha [Pseudomonadota bacterium]
MTKAEIVEQVQDKIEGISKKKAGDLVEAVFDLMKQTLVKGESVKLSGFGNFAVSEKKERVGRNPQTGESLTISARHVINFQVSQVLRDEINRS